MESIEARRFRAMGFLAEKSGERNGSSKPITHCTWRKFLQPNFDQENDNVNNAVCIAELQIIYGILFLGFGVDSVKSVLFE